MDDSATPRRRGVIGGAVGWVAPAVMRQIDANDLVDAIDVNVIAADLDLDALVDRLDLDAVAQRLDIDALVDRMDVNAVADRMDLDALVARKDVDAIAAQIDLDMLLDRLDVNAIADRLDLDLLVDRLDINALATRLDMARLTAGATQDVAVSGLDLVRRQIVRADATVDGISDRLLRRAPGDRRDAPRSLAEPAAEELRVDNLEPGQLQRRDVSGHYAGPVTRLLALAGDVVAVVSLQAVLAWATYLFFDLIGESPAASGLSAWVGVAILSVTFIAWFWIPVALFGRTLAMAVLGIAVVARDGEIVGSRRAFVRALVLPVSIVIPFGLIGLVVGKEHRGLHDVVSGTVVIYDWAARDAEQPVTIREQFSARVRLQKADTP